MSRCLLLLLALMPSACAVSDAAMPGRERPICEDEPDVCQPAATVHEEYDGNSVRPPTEATLLQGDATRIWLEPLRLPDGTLTRAGYVYLE